MIRGLLRVGHTIAESVGRDSAVIRRLRPVYQRFLGLATAGRGIPWQINGIDVRINPRHRHQFGSEYETAVAAFLASRVCANQTCFDVGANVGVYVLQFAHWTAPNGRIVAFEPNPAAADVLERTLRMNALTNRTTVVRRAVADRPGQATLHAAGTEGMSRLGNPNPVLAKTARPIAVTVTSIDAYVDDSGLVPDWLFVDVEGFELAVLRGATRLIASLGSRLGIVVEMHPDAWAGAGHDRSEMVTTLDALGLVAEPLTCQHDPLGEHGAVVLRHT